MVFRFHSLQVTFSVLANQILLRKRIFTWRKKNSLWS